MATPRTPSKHRLAPPASPADPRSRPTSPSKPATPGAVSRTRVAGGASASPQIKAALAALRKSRQAESSNIDSNSSRPASDPFSTPIRDRASNVSTASTASGSSGSAASSAARRKRDEVVLEWGVKPEDSLIEAAKKSGRLNLASRSLTAVPSAVYSALLPRSSTYHPSNRAPPTFRAAPGVDLSIPSQEDDRDESSSARWYEQQDLKTLNLSNNEIKVLEEEIGGFEELEILDFHSNALTTVPISLAWLVHLTALNLSSNHLASFPLQLLNLRHLRDLNLSHNGMRTLWPSDWRVQLNDTLKPPDASPSATPESPEVEGGFWDSFPSSPFKRREGANGPSSSKAPFPLLTTLSLAGNAFEKDSFTQEGFELPTRLTTLDLSECQLVDSAVPPEVFGSLRELVSFDLSGNDLGDDLFSPSLFRSQSLLSPTSSSSSPPPRLFPSLRTLDLSLNPFDVLLSPETFFTTHVRRPISYIGLAKPVVNLIRSEERQLLGGKRIGGGEEGPEVEVLVRECLMRGEQARRRAKFPPRAGEGGSTSAEPSALSPPSSNSKADSGPASRSVSPSDPPARTSAASPSPSASAAPSPCPSPASSISSKPHVILEDWEIEAAAGLSTPLGRRRAAAQAARERAERLMREEEEKRRIRDENERKERRRREEEKEKEEQEREKAEMDSLNEGMRKVAVDEDEQQPESPTPARLRGERSASPSPSPPPYSPRAPSPPESRSSSPSPSPPPAPLTEADPFDPALALMTAHLDAHSQSLNLRSQALSSLPVLSSGAPPSSLSAVAALDLSYNALTALPVSPFSTWGWPATLRTLNLSHNRIAALELLSDRSTVVFPSLESLDLSNNLLPSSAPSSSTSVPTLSALAALFPALGALSLAHNRLTSLAGIEDLLFPSSSASSSKNGVRSLQLNGNKISDLTALCDVAQRVGGAGAEGQRRWRCEELDLSDNEIGRLPPTLGLLPPSLVLAVAGNVFRVPRREVYENPGARLLLPWLRDRLV
ncbi:hypothetical protein JCM5296_001529 [Sporobolomyces johnsonii]